MLFIIALVFTIIYFIAYPMGPLPFYQNPVLTVDVPRELVEKGYPKTIQVDSEYMYSRYGLDYGRLVKDLFKDDGIYVDGRRISPEQAATEVIGGPYRVSAAKMALLAFSLTTFALALIVPQGSDARYREVGGVI